MITLAILLLLGLALIVFTIISVVVVGSVGFVIFGDIIVAEHVYQPVYCKP